jgi:poly-gamma-glutamate synthesis protein (capsule biosynthesis protein)
MRWAAYAAGGLILFLALHAGALMLHHPRVDPAPPVEIARPAAVAGEATVLFAGDTAEVDAALPLLEERGFEYPFASTVDLLRDADLTVVNHEAPITDGGRAFPLWKDYVYRAPSRSAAALAWAGIDVLGLANNHALDFGASGLDDTLSNAAAHGMVTVGAGRDPGEARRGVVATLGDVRVGLLAYCEEQILWRVYVDQFARPGHAGVAALVEDDVRRDVARLRAAHADAVVVMLHAGDNYEAPLDATVEWAERAVDAGADLVVIHHPHVAHPVDVYGGRPILLSLGNFAFGTPGRQELDYGLLAVAHLKQKRIDRVELIPIATQNRRVNYRPELLRDDELERALTRLRNESALWGAKLQIDRGRAILAVVP